MFTLQFTACMYAGDVSQTKTIIPTEQRVLKSLSRRSSQSLSRRSSHQRCSVRKGVLRNFAKFTTKHLHQSLFFNKVAGLRRQVLAFLQNTSGRLLQKPGLSDSGSSDSNPDLSNQRQ